jgi:hypothetical protein
MIRCYRTRIPACPRPAVKVIVVRYAGRVTAYWNVCDGHHSTAMHEAMEVSRLNGGAIGTSKIDIPVRKEREKLVNVNSVIPRDEHAEMVRVSQLRRMSQRAFVREAINNQIRLFTEGKSNDHQ